MEVKITDHDVKAWLGQLYLDMCQWRKAAQQAEAELIKTQAELILARTEVPIAVPTNGAPA